MKAKYLGLDLSSPVVVSSSPYTATVSNIEQCVRNGAGAVVLKSIFEEQIYRQAASLDRMEGYGDAGEYLERYLGEAYKAELLELVSDAAKTGIPVIGSIQLRRRGRRVDRICRGHAAGRRFGIGVEYLPASDRSSASAQELESHYAGIVRKVVAEVTIPVSVKLPMRLTNVLSVGDALLGRGAGGLVLYNRFFEPDIDIEKMCLVNGDPFSEPGELRNVLRSTALCRPCAPAAGHRRFDRRPRRGRRGQVAALRSGGGAGLHGDPQIRLRGDRGDEPVHRRVGRRQGFESLDEFRGRMDYGSSEGDFYQRVQYMKYFPHDTE